ncbi:response regulator receiver domain protein [Clostridiales bacterium oral taxon 876 str. F0540]|nr:response regulator receiver domain protein [Clostridiales bacterium oral taxon 876 str. F0540]
MCKILIVDDEYLLRQGIKHLVDWEKEGFSIVGEASNGKEALGLIETLKPHIILSDIVMPVMDGLELVKYVKENYPQIQIVILSGYSDFNYVKGTFKLGVNDYILKPKLNPDEIVTLLKNIALNIPNLTISTNEAKPNVINELNKLVSGFSTNLTRTEISEAFPCDTFLLLGTDVRKICSKTAENISRLKQSLIRRLKPLLNTFTYYELDTTKDYFVLIVNFNSKDYAELIECLNNLTLSLIHQCPDIYFSVSNTFNSLDNLKDTYNSFKCLLGYKFFLKNKSLIMQQELSDRSPKKKFDFKYYSEMLYSLNIASALDYLRQYIENSIIEFSIDEFELKTLFQNAFYNIINILEELNFDIGELSGSKIEYFQKIDDSRYADELLNILENINSDLTKALNGKESPIDDEIIGKITQYITSHYNEQLSLKDIADKFHFNYYYLSSYFSSHIAEGFSEYLNKIRVEKALELLRNEAIPVSEVSYLVGYSDHSYFCKVFKKFTKVTPSKFRKNILSNKRGIYE